MKVNIMKQLAGGLIAAGAAGLFVCGTLNHLPKLFRKEIYAVASGSMEPSLPAGSLIVVDTANRKPEPGTVLTCRMNGSGERTVTHRVYEVRENGDFILKGDANDTPDLNVMKPEDVIGTVVLHIPGLGFLLENGRIRLSLSVTMAVSAFLYAGGYLKKPMKGAQC